jgi:hypothetical protein
MVDKAFLIDVDDLRGLCGELKNYSLSVNPGSVTITQHDVPNGLNDISFIFPIVSDLSTLRAFHKKPESGLQACLHVYTGYQIRQSLHLEESGQVVQDPVSDWESFWNPLEGLLIREYEATLKL